MRARWAIAYSNISVQIREVDLKNKPKELLEISSKKTVPVLDLKDFVIEESIDIILWSLEESFDKNKFLDFYKRNHYLIDSLINENDNLFKYHLDRFKYSNRYKDININYHKTEALKILNELNKRIKLSSSNNKMGWLINNEESIADWAIWPFVRQFINSYPSIFEENAHLEELQKWVNYFINQDLFSYIMLKNKVWVKNDLPTFFGKR